MRKYLDYAIYWDLLICLIIGATIILLKSKTSILLPTPTNESLNSLSVSLITVSATLIGFLLTIITVIITFKKGFELDDKKSIKCIDKDIIPKETVFDRKISKQDKFYTTDLHKNVVNVFINASFEIGIVLFVLLYLQFCNSSIKLIWNSVIYLSLLLLVTFSVIRSLYIFRLFLKVHLK